MNDPAENRKPDRPALPRDAFRAQRIAGEKPPATPVIVTPDYDDMTPAVKLPDPDTAANSAQDVTANTAESPKRAPATRRPAEEERNPLIAYGERSSSRPYALRLPDAIDLVLRQMAAEERTHPLRIIDRILHDHLKKIGRLPPPRGA